MDDFNPATLYESKNEWGIYLLNIMTPLVIEGVYSIFKEAVKVCKQNKENSKYLMTFQKFIEHIPKWNQTVIEKECKRIIEQSKCSYLEELIGCVHIIQLKILTAARSSNTQKKIDIEIPRLNKFVHDVYISVASKVYKNAYLFATDVSALQTQKHRRELEIIVQECILNTIRNSIPIEAILKAYVDESSTEFIEESREEIVPAPHASSMNDQLPVDVKNTVVSSAPISETLHTTPNSSGTVTPALPLTDTSSQSIQFNDVDSTVDQHNNIASVVAPKTVERLEQISAERNLARKQDEYDDATDSDDLITISDQDVSLEFDTLDSGTTQSKKSKKTPIILDDIEVLE